MIPTVIISLLLLIVQVSVINGLNMDDTNRNIIALVGIVALGVYAATGKIKGVALGIGLPIIGIVLISLQRWIWGHTDFAIIQYVAAWGLILMASKAKPKYIALALVAGILIQAAIQHYDLIAWSQTFADKDSIWGTFRHRIRYSTWMLAGVIGSWYVFNDKHNGLLRWLVLPIAALGLYEIGRAHSNTIMALAAAVVIIAVWQYIGRGYAVAILVSCLLAVFAFNIDGYAFKDVANGNGRIGMWSIALAGCFDPWYSFFIGHGAGAWHLDCGTLGLSCLSHPHCELLHILYDYGFIGVWWTISICLGAVTIGGAKSHIIGIGALFIMLSMMTNSAQYSEMWLLCCVFIGMGLSDLLECDDEICECDCVPVGAGITACISQ